MLWSTAVLALVAGVGVAVAWPRNVLILGPPPLPVPVAVARAAFAEERAFAEARGFSRAAAAEPSDIGESAVRANAPSEDGSHWTLSLRVAARECVAVVLATDGFVLPHRVALLRGTDSSGPWLSRQYPAGLASHVQWCDPLGSALTLAVRLRSHDANERPAYLGGTLHYEILRASWDRIGGSVGITRGEINIDAVRALIPTGRTRAFLDRAPDLRPPNSEPMFASPLEIPSRAARVIPVEAGTYAVLHGVVGALDSSGANPVIETTGQEVEPFLPTSRTAPPILRAPDGGNIRRVIAVVAAGTLAHDCLTVVFRRGVGLLPAMIYRLNATGGGEAALMARENAASDELCAAQGTVIYTVADNDAAVYDVQLYTPVPFGDAGSTHR